MRFYRVPDAPAGSRWQRRQDDARRLGNFVAVDIPTDHKGLAEWLNGKEESDHLDVALPAPPQTETVPQPPASVSSLTEAEEFIQSADAGQLASLANNVCWRLKELTKAL